MLRCIRQVVSFMPRIKVLLWALVFVGLILPGFAGSAFLPRTWEPKDRGDIEGTLIRQDRTTATIAVSGGRGVSLPLSDLSDEDLRYLSNLRDAKEPMRSWTLQDDQGAHTMHGSFISVNGFDTPLSQTFVVLVLDDGRKRGYPLNLFSEVDKSYVAQHGPASSTNAPSDASPSDEYKVQWTDFNPQWDKDTISWHATKHFLFIWGNKIEDSAKNWTDPQFRQMNYDYFEQIWDFNQNIQHAPMPYQHDAQKYKTRVYITGTGLKGHEEGFAFGGLEIEVNPTAMLAGSSVLPHEFTHTLQQHTGGYTGNLAQLVGWFWECHANWNACQFDPSVALALEVYNDRMHYELSSTRDNYGSWPFLEFFAEHPRFDPGFDFDVWTHNKRNGDNSIETPFATMIRLGREEGKFPGDGVMGFGDMIGEMAAHNVTWDYTYQWTYRKTIADFRKAIDDTSRDRTLLLPVSDRPGWYRPMYAQSPKQYGVNIVDLVPAPGGHRVTVNFQGIVDEKEHSDWRVTLVAIDRQGRARYSRMWRAGRGAITLKPGETRLALAIAAAPDVYMPTGFRIGFNAVRHYPYEVSFTGCKPSTVPDYVHTKPGVPGAPHPNGGGFVAATAHVDPAAYVAPGATVLDQAQVLGNARIDDHAIIAGSAMVQDSAIVSGYAQVRGHAQVTDHARVGGLTTVEDDVHVGENAHVIEAIRVHGRGHIAGDALVKGFGDLYVGPDGPIGGGAIVGENAEVHADDWKTPIDGGLLYEFMSDDELRGLQDNHFLTAYWDFRQPRAEVLKDAFTDNDGTLRGHPAFLNDSGHSSLALNGKNQYALIDGSLAALTNITVDMQIKWQGGAVGQRLLSFGSATGELWITPKDAHGHAAVSIRLGNVTTSIEADRALPVGRWTRVTFMHSGTKGVLYLDGKKAGQTDTMTIGPDDVQATDAALGSDISGRHCFHGMLSDVAIYRTSFPNVAALTNHQ